MAYEQLIESYYEAVLRETPTDAQIELWESVLSDADDLEEAIADFAQALCLQAEEVRSILRLYQAVFDRVSDSGGLTYWTNTFRQVQEDNPDLSYKEALIETITQWLESDEYVERFGSELADEDFLSLLYINILGRPADQDGYDFWLAILKSGDMTREQLIIEFTESDELKDQMDEEANNLLKTAAALASDETADDPDYEIPGDDVYQGELGNEAPTDILVGTDVDEDAENGDLVNEGQLTAVDPDGGETFTWELIDPSGAFGLDDPNAQQPNIIVVDASKLDHETADVMTVTIRVTDSAGNTYEEEVQIDVNDVNEAPTDILPEGPIVIDDPDAVDAEGDVVTTLTAEDEDDGDSHTFTIVSQTVANAFQILPNSNELQVEDPSLLGTGIHEITIEVTDSGGETTQRTITIDLSELNEEGDDFAFTLDQDALGGTDRNDTYRANSGSGADDDRGEGFGRTANAGDYANGGDGYDRFILTREDNEQDDYDRSAVTGVELENIELLELTNGDDSSDSLEDTVDIDWGACDPFIDMPTLAPDESSELLFQADKSPNIDRVEVTDSTASVIIYDLQEEFWTKTPDDETDTGPTVLIDDTTATQVWIDSDIQSKEFVDEDGDGKDDGELVVILDESKVNELRITENASDKVPGDSGGDGDRGEQVGTITLQVTGDTPSYLGRLNNGDGDEDDTGSFTHTLNIEVSDLTDSRPSTGKPGDATNLASMNSAAIDFFLGIDSGYELGDGLLGLENINITGDGDVFLAFDEDIDNDDDDGDGFTIEIQDSGGNSFFHFEEDSFGNDVKLDGGDGFDTLIINHQDLVDHPNALDNVTNIERLIVLDTPSSIGDSYYDEDGMRSYIPAIDQCLFGDDGDDQLVGAMGDDFLDAGHGGSDVLVGDHQPFYYVTRVAFDSDDGSVNEDDVFEIEVDWDGDGVADYTASYTAASDDEIDDVVDALKALLEDPNNNPDGVYIGDSNSNNSLYIQQPGEGGSTAGVLSATKTSSSGVTEDLPVTNSAIGSDIFVAGARDIEDFSDGFDNDNLPEDVDGLMEAAGLAPDSDGADEGADGVVYVLDFNQGSHGNNVSTPVNEAYNANEGDLLAFRDSDGILDECGTATNYQEVQDQGVDRDNADANAFNAFASNDGLRYYVNARSFESALLENTDMVWGVDVTQNTINRALEAIENGDDSDLGPNRPYSGQELIDMINGAKADSWLRVYYNEEGTDATPEAVFELVGLDNISQFSFDDIAGADCIEDKTDPFEFVLC